MISSSFQLAPGLGPRRELGLWQAGVSHWEEYGSAGPRLSGRADEVLRGTIQAARAAHARGDVDALAALLPAREHWRLFHSFGADAAYLDIETSDDVVGFAGISAIGFLDKRGPRLLLAGRDLQRFPELALGWSMLVTFNGLSFDVPILRRAFPEWQPPVAHLDLRHALARLGIGGGLKAIERRLSSYIWRVPSTSPGSTAETPAGSFGAGGRVTGRLYTGSPSTTCMTSSTCARWRPMHITRSSKHRRRGRPPCGAARALSRSQAEATSSTTSPRSCSRCDA